MQVLMWLVAAAGLLAAADPLAQVFDQATAALASRNYDAAEVGFQRVLKAMPNHVGALGNLGVVYSRTGRPDKAIEVYGKSLRLSPNEKGLRLNLGLVHMNQESWAEAVLTFQALADSSPGNLQARELLATCQLHTNDVATSVRSLESLRAEDTKNIGLLYLLGVGYLKLKQPDKAREALEQFVATAAPTQGSLLLCKAYYDSELFDEAAAQCRKTIELDSNFPGAHRELGKVLLSQRDPGASRELRQAVQQDSYDSEALYFLGASLLQEDRIVEATTNLERAQRLKPGFWGSYYYLGRAKLQSDSTAQAIPLLQRAAELNPDESAIFYQLGRAFATVGRKQEAARAMEKVRELKARSMAKETNAIQKR